MTGDASKGQRKTRWVGCMCCGRKGKKREWDPTYSFNNNLLSAYQLPSPKEKFLRKGARWCDGLRLQWGETGEEEE